MDYLTFTSACVCAESVAETVVATKGVFTLPTNLPLQVPVSLHKDILFVTETEVATTGVLTPLIPNLHKCL